ncbi:MAG: hypothetical protein GY932_08480, partial [Arcobacter sp.]|nr:hypothetical protein [Arcobacter sp.]
MFFLSSSIRTGQIFFLFVSLILFFFLWIFNPLAKYFKKKSHSEIFNVSKSVGNYFPDVKDNLLNSLQLLDYKNSASENLIEAAFEKVYNQIKEINFLEIINYSSLKKDSKIFFAILSVFISCLLISPSISSASLRLINFNSDYSKPAKFYLEVITGNDKIKKGNNILLTVKGNGELPNDIFISTKTKYDSEFLQHNVMQDSNNIYSIKLKNVKNSFKYFANSGKVKTNEFFIEVVDPPIINSLSLDIIPPKYSNLPLQNQQDNGNVSGLLGTIIKFNISGTKELQKAVIIKSDSSTIQLKVNNSKVNGNMQIKNNFSYTIHLEDKDRNKNETPITYLVKTIADKHPIITVTSPKKTSLLPNNDIVNITASIKDDFGFSKLSLFYKLIKPEQNSNDNEFEQKEISFNKSNLEQEIFYNWNFLNMIVREKDAINFYLEVFDNDFVSGPKSTKSEVFIIRIPTLNELFKQAEVTQNEAEKNLEEVFKEAKELQKDLSELKNELKRNEEKIDWNEKEKVE